MTREFVRAMHELRYQKYENERCPRRYHITEHRDELSPRN